MTEIYTGEILIAGLDPEGVDSLEDIEEQLEDSDILDVEDDEDLYVSVSDGELVVKKLQRR